MQKLGFLLFMFSIPSIGFALSESQIDYACPDILVCKAADGPKLNLYFAKNDQKAYECYQANGDIGMTHQAGIAETSCQTMYAASTATIKKD